MFIEKLVEISAKCRDPLPPFKQSMLVFIAVKEMMKECEVFAEKLQLVGFERRFLGHDILTGLTVGCGVEIQQNFKSGDK